MQVPKNVNKMADDSNNLVLPVPSPMDARSVWDTFNCDWNSCPPWFVDTVSRVIHGQSARDRVSQVKYQLEGWREVLVPVHSVLTWQRPYYPLVVWAFVSLVFGIFYMLNPSVLTTFAIIGIVIMLADYLMPHVQAKLYDPNKWTGAKERKFEDFCYGLACAEESANSFIVSMKEMKRTKPSVYFMTVIVGLLLLAWIGSMIASLWLTYLIVSTLVMIPGLVHRGYLQRFILGPTRPLAHVIEKNK